VSIWTTEEVPGEAMWKFTNKSSNISRIEYIKTTNFYHFFSIHLNNAFKNMQLIKGHCNMHLKAYMRAFRVLSAQIKVNVNVWFASKLLLWQNNLRRVRITSVRNRMAHYINSMSNHSNFLHIWHYNNDR